MNAFSAERLPGVAILALDLTQIIGYRTLYYSFSILAPDMARNLNWSSEWIFQPPLVNADTREPS